MIKFLLSKIAAPVVGKALDTVGREVGLITGKTEAEKIEQLLGVLTALQNDNGCFCNGPLECTLACVRGQEIVRAYVRGEED